MNASLFPPQLQNHWTWQTASSGSRFEQASGLQYTPPSNIRLCKRPSNSRPSSANPFIPFDFSLQVPLDLSSITLIPSPTPDLIVTSYARPLQKKSLDQRAPPSVVALRQRSKDLNREQFIPNPAIVVCATVESYLKQRRRHTSKWDTRNASCR
jgi:hypothetical protein